MAPRLMAATASVDAAEAGDHDGADLGVAGERRVEDVHAVGVGQAEVDDEARRRRSALRRSMASAASAAWATAKPSAFSDSAIELAEIGLVFDDEHGGLGGAGHHRAVTAHDTSAEILPPMRR